VGLLGAIGPIPGGSVAAWTPAALFGPGAFSSSSFGTFDDGATDTFSLFAQVSVNFAGAGPVSFDENQRVVPEPASLLLLGAGRSGGRAVAALSREHQDGTGWRRGRGYRMILGP
jgi:hypothetical protein